MNEEDKYCEHPINERRTWTYDNGTHTTKKTICRACGMKIKEEKVD